MSDEEKFIQPEICRGAYEYVCGRIAVHIAKRRKSGSVKRSEVFAKLVAEGNGATDSFVQDRIDWDVVFSSDRWIRSGNGYTLVGHEAPPTKAQAERMRKSDEAAKRYLGKG